MPEILMTKEVANRYDKSGMWISSAASAQVTEAPLMAAPQRGSTRDSVSPPTRRKLLLVGVAARALQGTVEAWLASTQPASSQAGWEIGVADSMLEAVLVSGGPPSEADETASQIVTSVVVVDVSHELRDLEAGVRSLRKVNPVSRIVLLCEPCDEALCRKARAWGVDDYYILPLDSSKVPLIARERQSASSQRIMPSDLAAAEIAEARRVMRRETLGGHGLPALPLIVQGDLLEQILGGNAEIAPRAVAALNEHLHLNGEFYYLAASAATGEEAKDADESNNHRTMKVPVILPDQSAGGILVFQQDPETTPSPLAGAAVVEAANWLATMLALCRRHEQLRALAITDELSGAYNRRYFLQYMNALLKRARDGRRRVTLLLFDIDDFKKYNDTFGHASGDAIIRELIKLLQACTRQNDLVARIGGDEFAVVYGDSEAPRQPNSEHPRDVLVATERFREAIRNHQWTQTCNIKGEVSISGGLATFPLDADTVESLMERADKALLKAKAAGKNVIVIHAPQGTPAAT
jgi:diguanylate cyclase (GGDEF)-like protein